MEHNNSTVRKQNSNKRQLQSRMKTVIGSTVVSAASDW